MQKGENEKGSIIASLDGEDFSSTGATNHDVGQASAAALHHRRNEAHQFALSKVDMKIICLREAERLGGGCHA